MVIAGKIVGYVVLTLVAAGVASILYRFGPSREDAQWKWITPGSLFAAVTWLLLTWAFGIYVSRFTNYHASYGSFGAVVALLSWMYLSAYAFIVRRRAQQRDRAPDREGQHDRLTRADGRTRRLGGGQCRDGRQGSGSAGEAAGRGEADPGRSQGR